MDLTKQLIFLKSNEDEVKEFSNFKELYIFITLKDEFVTKVTNTKIIVETKDKKKKEYQYAMLTHDGLKENFEFDVNEHRINLHKKIDDLEKDGVILLSTEKDRLNEQFSFLPENLLDN